MINKKVLIFTLFLILTSFFLVSCQTEETTTGQVYYTVIFKSNGGTEIDSITVASGSVIAEPAQPTRDGYIFNGWQNGIRDWVFGIDSVNANLTLDARWINASSIFNYEIVDDKAVLVSYKGSLRNITIPEKIEGYSIGALGDNLFKNFIREDEARYTITVPASITIIGESAFANLSDVTINVKSKLTQIGEHAFKGCNGLTEIQFADGIGIISFESFYDCVGLTKVTIPASVTVIDENAFDGCISLTSIVVSKGVEVKNGAFSDCDALKYIHFTGTEDEFDEIVPEGMNNAWKTAQVFIYSAEKPDEIGDYWYYDEKGNISYWKS